jgi:transcriptional regulator with XRE-family HTH domain
MVDDSARRRRQKESTNLKVSAIDWKKVGRRLRELRGFDITQNDLAGELEISQGQLSRYERGEGEIGPEILLRISNRFRKPIEWILTGKTTKRF